MKKIPLEISARHIHLCQEDIEKLFGKGYELKVCKELSQPGMFAAKETVDIIFIDKQRQERALKEVRVVGPQREKTQLEISLTEAWKIKAKPPIRTSGNIKNSPGFEIIGPKERVAKKEGMIIARRHLHVDPDTAKTMNLKDGQIIKVQAGLDTKRRLVFDQIKVRVNKDYKLTCHIDTDEGNAAGMRSCGYGYLVK
ncbi:MAG: phosphate propanoyltransferase [Candidatus Moranbacteria bacterium]|nr:phosphate propanoyltransferase [Candidatus Moranbacteria bacterium]